MYPYKLPHTIENCLGEKLTFQRTEIEDGATKMIVTNEVDPGCGPEMHVHFKQDEALTVIEGRMGYQVKGGPELIAEEGETVLFERGTFHRFWNADERQLKCEGWLKPANTTDYFLTALYNSINKAGKAEGDPFDGAYLITRYSSEYDVDVIPGFVKKVIMPITAALGKMLGKYDHFKDAPAPLK